MKSSVVKLLTLLLVFVSFVLLNQSCKKLKEDSPILNELQVIDLQLEKLFYTTNDSVPASVKKVSSYLQKRKDKSEIATSVINAIGLPAWGKAVIIESKSHKNSTGSRLSSVDTTYLFIPIVPQGTEEVEGAFACRIVGDSVSVSLLNEKNYKEYGFDITKPRNAHQLVSLMMFLQARAFGTESFIVNDGRLFGNSSSVTDSTTKRFVYIGNISSTVPALKQQNKGGIAADYIVETIICYYNNTNRISSKGAIAASVLVPCITTYEWIPTGGSSSGSYDPGGGSGGGGTSSTASISITEYFQQTLGLTSTQLSVLNTFPLLAEECFNYLQIPDGQLTYEEQKKLVASHILYLKPNPLYLEYCESVSVQNSQAQGKYYPWFRNNTLFSSNLGLANNIQNLKLNAEQAFYLLNNAALNIEVNKYLLNNSFSEDAKYTILTKLYPEQYPGISFDNITSPSNAPDDPIVDNGISVEDIPQTPPQQAGRRIGKTANRNNTEDMQYGTNGDVSGILTSEVAKDNNALFSNMSDLFYWCTIRDNELATVGNAMIERFRTNTAPSTVYENPVLNQKVEYSAAFVNFLKLFGNKLRDGLIEKQGDINGINEIDMGKVRPIFNGAFNMTNGLQILINDTEYTEIQLDEFHVDINGKWTADVTVTIYDHFGLDKLDALVYQKYHAGFADWWLLQHARGFVPYTTKVTVRKRISGHL